MAPAKGPPGPGSYQSKTTIGEGPKIGLSPRYVGKKPTLLIPGPGAYEPQVNVISEKMPSPGIGYGTRGGMPNKTLAIVPGPGAYTTLDEKREGPKYGFGTSQRVSHKVVVNPGPGNYEIASTVAAVPGYEKSKMK